MLTCLLAFLFAFQQPAPSVAGDWIGTLDAGTAKLRILLHITQTPQGFSTTLDSPDQHALGIKTAATTYSDGTLKVNVAPNGAVNFAGTLKDATLTGNWTQAGHVLPLVLTHVKNGEGEQARKPQDPVKPYPYRSEDLTYLNKAQGDTLAATLTIPEGKGPFPAVVLITGSGAQDRDEALLGHRPFLVLSDYLTRHGIAVLRADDRGTAKSTGTFATATTADFATDTQAGLDYLATRPEIDHHRTGLIGHSEGGVIAPMIAARNKDVAFIVLLAGTGVDGAHVIAEQTRLLELAGGAPAAKTDADAKLSLELTDLVIHESPVNAANDAELKKKLHQRMALAYQPAPAEPLSPRQEAAINASITQMTGPWFRFFYAYDPAVALRKVTCPVLALDGTHDLQVPPEQNLTAIRAALTAGGNTQFEAIEYPNLNHLFQTSPTGSPSEYANIEETMAPVVLDKIAAWITKQ